MKIGGKNPPIQLDAYLKHVRQQPKEQLNSQQQAVAHKGADIDKVHLSDEARQVQQAAQAIKETPDGHEKKVQQVKMEIDKETYKVVGARVATDMLRETFENNLILQKIDTQA